MGYGHAQFLLVRDDWLKAARQEIEDDLKNESASDDDDSDRS